MYCIRNVSTGSYVGAAVANNNEQFRSSYIASCCLWMRENDYLKRELFHQADAKSDAVYYRSNRSRLATLTQAATKSLTNLASPSALP